MVRIFTSSTFTDMLMERNTLMEYVYPKIKEYCREKHGLEYQVVDMRWGVRDEMTDEHMTTVRRNGTNLKRKKQLCLSMEGFPMEDTWLFTITSTGSLHERTAWVPEIQHGTQLHLLWSSKVRILLFWILLGFSFLPKPSSGLGPWPHKM